MLFLPESRRHLFQKPFGNLFSSLDIIGPELQVRPLFTVGDVVTENVLRAGIIPDIAIIDGQTMRRPYEGVSIPEFRQIPVKNPPGYISDALVEGIGEALRDMGTVISVDGEEDLAVLPLVMQAPIHSILLYGQPGEGVVLLRVTPETKEQAEDMLTFFEASDPL